jgi:H+/gluconate symporter-like permease
MTAVPGTPQIQNIIPAKYFNTTSFAAPLFGICGALIIFIVGTYWLERRKKKMLAAGEGYGEEDTRAQVNLDDGVPEVPAALAALPLVAVLGLNFVLTKIIGSWDVSMLEPYKKIPLVSSAIPVANWALIISLIVGILLSVIFAAKQFKARGNLQAALNGGAIGSLLAIMNTASETGYGNVVSSLPGFSSVRDFLLSIDPGTPLLSEALTVNVLAGITGSASGGLCLAVRSGAATAASGGLCFTSCP